MANQYDLTPRATDEEIEKRRFEIMKLRRIGHTWEEIAEKIGQMFNRRISYVQCAEDYRQIMAARAKELNIETDAIRSEQIHRLTTAVNRIWARIDAENPSLDHIEMLIKLETRLARLTGTDAPVKSEVDDKRKPLALSEAQIKAKMAEIYARLNAQRLPEVSEIPVVDATIVDNTLHPALNIAANEVTDSASVSEDLVAPSVFIRVLDPPPE